VISIRTVHFNTSTEKPSFNSEAKYEKPSKSEAIFGRVGDTHTEMLETNDTDI
jgi:hypothetical protein